MSISELGVDFFNDLESYIVWVKEKMCLRWENLNTNYLFGHGNKILGYTKEGVP